MGGSLSLCSTMRTTPWQAVCRGWCVQHYCTMYRDNPCLCRPLHNLTTSQEKILTLSFTFPRSFSTLLCCFHGDQSWRTRAVTNPQQQLFKISHQLSALHTGPPTHHIPSVDCYHCIEASVRSSIEQQRQLSLFVNNSVLSAQLNSQMIALQ